MDRGVSMFIKSKKIIRLMYVFLFFILVSITSCNNDDDNNGTQEAPRDYCSEERTTLSKELKTKKLEEIDGCMQMNKITKKEICVSNYVQYCTQSFYECGESGLKGYCNEIKNIYGNSESKEISFDETKLNNYCSGIADANEDTTQEDSFSQVCVNYRDNLECDSVPELDFISDNWSTQCTSK